MEMIPYSSGNNKNLENTSMNTLKLTAAAIALAVAGSVYAGGGAAMSAPAAPKAPAQSQQKMFVRMGFGSNVMLYKITGNKDIHTQTSGLNATSFGVGYNMGKLAVVVSLNHSHYANYNQASGTVDSVSEGYLEVAPEYHMNMCGAQLALGLGLGFHVHGTDRSGYSKADLLINPYVGMFASVSKNVKVGGTFGFLMNDHKWANDTTESQSGLSYSFDTQIGF
jgi:hypothetical protein